MVTHDRVEVLAAGSEWLDRKRQVIGVLEAGQHAAVSGCEKVNGGTAPRVRLGLDKVGYVLDRVYQLERGSVSSAALLSPRSIVFSCAGKLRRMSRYH